MGGSFVVELQAFEDKVPNLVSKTIKKVTLDIHAAVSNSTPRDTGRASGNWLCGDGFMPTEVTDNTSIAVSIAKARVALANYEAAGGRPVDMVNNLDYIQALENGHSKQAANGMLQVTLEDFERFVKRAAK